MKQHSLQVKLLDVTLTVENNVKMTKYKKVNKFKQNIF